MAFAEGPDEYGGDTGREGMDFGGGGRDEFGSMPGGWAAPQLSSIPESLAIALQPTPEPGFSFGSFLPESTPGWLGSLGATIGSALLTGGATLGPGLVGGLLGDAWSRSRQEDLDRQRAGEFSWDIQNRPSPGALGGRSPIQPVDDPMMGRDDPSSYLPLSLAQAPQSPLTQLPLPSFAPYPTKQFTGLPNLAGYGRTDAPQQGAHPFFSPVTAQRGGLMDLRNQATNLAAQGRGGDSMLVHMRPDEVAGLQALGGVSRNPNTGLPENFLGSTLGSLAGLALMPFTGGAINPFVMQALGAGGGQFLEGKIKGLSTQQAIEQGIGVGAAAGLGSWGLSKLGGAAAAGTAATSTAAATPPGIFRGIQDFTPGALSTAKYQPFGAYSPDVYKAITPEMWMGAGGLGGLSGYLGTPPVMGMPEEEEDYYADLSPRYRRRARDIRDINLKDYGYRPEERFFRTQYFDKGGEASKPDEEEEVIEVSETEYERPRHLADFGELSLEKTPSEELLKAMETDEWKKKGISQEALLKQLLRRIDPRPKPWNFKDTPLARILGEGSEDTPPAKLSEDEFVIPTEYLKFPRPQHFDDLQLPAPTSRGTTSEETKIKDLLRDIGQVGLPFARGGIVEAGEMMEEAGPEGDVVAEEVTAQAVSAVRGDHPQPEEAISTYVEMFGEEQFGRLRELVVEQMQIGQLGGEEEIEAEGMVSGPGAGRDDLIRGTIEGEQELRVSDGEFIVPADVVSGIGDGSSDAGAKRLHAMIDNIRKTRTGTDEQPARIDEAELLPT